MLTKFATRIPVSYLTDFGRKILCLDFKDEKGKLEVLETMEDMKNRCLNPKEDIFLILVERGAFKDLK